MSPYRLPSGEVLIPAVASDGGSLSGDGMIKCWPTDPRVWAFERYYALFGEKIPDYPGSASFAAPTATLAVTGDPEALARFRAEAGLVGDAAFAWTEDGLAPLEPGPPPR